MRAGSLLLLMSCSSSRIGLSFSSSLMSNAQAPGAYRSASISAQGMSAESALMANALLMYSITLGFCRCWLKDALLWSFAPSLL